MSNLSKLKSVFIDAKIKKIIELHMSIEGFTTRSKALEDLLIDSPKYIRLTKKLELFNTSNDLVTLSESKEESPQKDDSNKSPLFNSEDFLDLTNKSVDELLNEGEK